LAEEFVKSLERRFPEQTAKYRETEQRRADLADHPDKLLAGAGLPPDPWQSGVLRDRVTARLLLLCSRQAGKSTVAAALALREAILSPPALVLLLSPTLRQSGELFRDKVLRLYNALGRPVLPARLTATEIQLTNGSRIVSLPENEETVRGFSSVSLLVIDEAARVSDDLYRAVRPMLAVSGGKLVCLSTPFGKRGFFHDAWNGATEHWRRVLIPAKQCRRIPDSFLAEERLALGETAYAQEYDCVFNETEGAVFTEAVLARAFGDPTVQPFFQGDPLGRRRGP
jgi:hypothetical protein